MSNKQHIMLVEDDEALQELIKKLLTNNEYIVSIAKNIQEAEKLLQLFVFDLIILDDIEVDILAKFLDASANTLFFSAGVAPLKSLSAFFISPFTFVTADLAPLVSPNVIVVPKTELATFVTFPVAAVICSAVSVSTCLLDGLDSLF